MSNVFTDDCLAGLTVLCTGASSGIGAVSACRLAEAGAALVLSGRDKARLDEVAERAGNVAAVIPADLEADGEAERLAAETLRAVGHVDVLFNCAGYGPIQRTQSVTEVSISNVFNVNTRAALVLTARLVDRMAQAGGGSIINMSSVTGSIGTPFQATYAASKGALDAMTRSLAREFGSKRIRVNSVAPGLISTGEPEGTERGDMFRGAAAYVALPELAAADAVADVIVFLASPAARYITGQTIYVDGGTVHTGDIVAPSSFRPRSPAPQSTDGGDI